MTGFEWCMVGLVALFTSAAAILDSRTRSIPNWLTVPAFLLALAFHMLTAGWSGLGDALASG